MLLDQSLQQLLLNGQSAPATKANMKGTKQVQAKHLPVMTPEKASKAPPGTRFRDINSKLRMR